MHTEVDTGWMYRRTGIDIVSVEIAFKQADTEADEAIQTKLKEHPSGLSGAMKLYEELPARSPQKMALVRHIGTKYFPKNTIKKTSTEIAAP